MLFTCGHQRHRNVRAPDHGGSQTVSKETKTLTIDIHCHRQCYPAGEMMQAEAKRTGFSPLSFGSELTKEVNLSSKKTLRRELKAWLLHLFNY